MPLISIVVPCFNEEEALPHFYRAVAEAADHMPGARFEFIFVDDGSKDGTLAFLRACRMRDGRVKYLSFSRNFGKESAMYAGLSAASGDYVAVMDADMQDPPSLLPDMLRFITDEGYDCVATRRETRTGEPPVRSFFARLFYRLINKISKVEIVDGARDFRLMTRQMADAVLSMGESNRFSKGIFAWVGFKTKWIAYENTRRVAGKTKWSFFKLFIYSLEGIMAFSVAPLAMAAAAGLLFCLIALAIACWMAARALFGVSAGGWLPLACVVFFVGGVQLFCTGIAGGYLAKAYLETKRRPIYIVKEREV